MRQTTQAFWVRSLLATTMVCILTLGGREQFGTSLARASRGQCAPATGGPDAFGYTYDATVPFQWIDTTGGVAAPNGDDFSRGAYDIGFPFRFYGVAYSKFYISTNGMVIFDAGVAPAGWVWDNAPIPTASMPNNFAAPFWDDLKPLYTAVMRFRSFGSQPNRYLVVEWNTVGLYNDFDHPVTFEAIFYEGTNDIKFQYASASSTARASGSSATVGIEDVAGRVGLNYSYDEASLRDGLAIYFQYPRGTPDATTPTRTNTPTPSRTPSTTAVPATCRLNVDPPAKIVLQNGGAFIMDAYVENVTDLGGFEFTLNFDPAIVRVDAIALGSLVTGPGRAFTTLTPQIDNSAGSVSFGAFSYGAEPGRSGSGSIATLTLSPVSVGTSALHFDAVQLARPNGDFIATSTQDGTVVVQAPGDGFLVSGADRPQHRPAVACDAANGLALVAWEDYGTGPNIADIHGQLVGLNSQLVAGDIPVCIAGKNQYEPEVAYNGRRSEYLVVWYDAYQTESQYVRAQRVSALGSVVGNVIDVATSTTLQINPAVAYDSHDDEYLVVWEDGAVNVMGQRLSGLGALLGGPFIVSGAIRYQSSPDIAYNPDRNEYLVVWHDFRNNQHTDIWAQCVSGQGTVIGDNFAICTDAQNQDNPKVAYGSGSGRYLVAWQDYRNGQTNTDVYAQLVSDSGGLWGSQLVVSAAARFQIQPDVAYDPMSQEFLVVWSDNRVDDYNILGQRITPAGTLVSGNFSVCSASGNQDEPDVAWTGRSGTWIVAWQDLRSGAFDIWAAIVATEHATTPTPTPTASVTPTPSPTGSPTATATRTPTPGTPSPTAPAASIAVEPAGSIVLLDESCTTGVVVRNVADLGGFEYTLRYNPAVVHVEGVALGSFLSSTGRTVSAIGPVIDNQTGSVTFGAFSFGGAAGPSGTGALASMTFRAVAAGSTALTFGQVQLTDTHAAPLSIGAMTGGAVTVLEVTETATSTPASTLTATPTASLTPVGHAIFLPMIRR